MTNNKLILNFSKTNVMECSKKETTHKITVELLVDNL